ncbi:3'-5' exonuclease domain-containing protein [Mycena chlorophos]|uniref:3'-5' exonuclease domain-containing protein n=1 Tax=Mycena chlorophos TaxID=658473 RepID=A0A8H6T8I4_MYCCL|nr:3'-5' exonuclease domain-containing protein [Mycena chlorophos]
MALSLPGSLPDLVPADTVIVVDTVPLLRKCIAAVAQTSSLAVDLEGIAMSRSGSICILQLKARESNLVWLVDIVALGAHAFTERVQGWITLKTLLESPLITKLFYDVRNDSDALYNIFGVSLGNVYDLQLLELATRASNPAARHRIPARFVVGLGLALEEHVAPTRPSTETNRWARVKEQGEALFAPERGGRYEVFSERPLTPALIEYCAQDVALLHELEVGLRRRGMGAGNWEQRIVIESAARVWRARQLLSVPRGPDEALAPVNW